MSNSVDHTQPQFPGDRVRSDSFYIDGDADIPPNGILMEWGNDEDVIRTTYDTLQIESKQITDGWFTAKNEAPREVYKDLPCAMFTACTLSLRLVKEAIGTQLADENGSSPVYFKGSMSSHILLAHTMYESFAAVAEPFAKSMEMTWNAMEMFKAEKSFQETIANEMNFRLYVYACSLCEGRLGHRFSSRRQGLNIKEWFEQEKKDIEEYDRVMESSDHFSEGDSDDVANKTLPQP